MKNTTIEPIQIVGIAVRTTNKNKQAAIDIPKLWETFMEQDIFNQIPNKVADTIYVIYSDYEGDYTKPYTTYIGCHVSTLENIPASLVHKTIGKGSYAPFLTNRQEIYEQWVSIWNMPLERNYTTDFEVHHATKDEIIIYIALT